VNHSSNQRVALALLAHPDDAEILCGGTLIRLQQEHGYEIHIATATAGDCGTMDRTMEAISTIRREEARRAAALIDGCYHCLEEKDGFVVYDRPTIRKAIDLMRKIVPSIVFTHAAKDYMLDHEQTSMLARAATFISSAPNASELPLASHHRIPYLYYCDPIEGLEPSGTRVQPTTYVPLNPLVHELKLEMLGQHASQRDWLRAHHGMDEYLDAVRRHDRSRADEIDTQTERFAEAFVQHRGHAYPVDDMLNQLFSWEETECLAQ
jgi:LmbE family N-acetylglucosaminyl deacetylase